MVLTQAFIKAEDRQESSQSAADPYAAFNPRAYITEYYSDIGPENEFLLKFYHDTYDTFAHGLSLLEFGGGPTVYQLLSASRKATEIVFTDYLPCNLREVSSWVGGDSQAFSWRRFAEAVSSLESGNASQYTTVEGRTRSVIRTIVRCDALKVPLVREIGYKTFDIVSSGFCLECISGDESAFLFALSNVVKWVVPGGSLLLTLLKNSRAYQVGDNAFPAYPLNAELISRLLVSSGFAIRDLRETEAEDNQGYEGLIAIHARNHPHR